MKTLLDVVDELDIAHDIVECASMATASDIPAEWADPIRAVLNIASEKLVAIREAVEQIREHAKE